MMHGDSRVMVVVCLGRQPVYQHPVCQLPLPQDPAKNLFYGRLQFVRGSCALLRHVTRPIQCAPACCGTASVSQRRGVDMLAPGAVSGPPGSIHPWWRRR